MTTINGNRLKLADIEATHVDPGLIRYVRTAPGASLRGSADGPDGFQKLDLCSRLTSKDQQRKAGRRISRDRM